MTETARRLTLTLACLAATSIAGQTQQRPLPGVPPPAMAPMQLPIEVVRLLLALDRLQANRWYPSTPQLQQILSEDQQRVQDALASRDPELRRIAVRGMGRFENPQDVPSLAVFLNDKDPRVRREAANAIAQAVEHRNGADVLPALSALQMSMLPPGFPDTVPSADRAAVMASEATRLEAIARLHYTHDIAQQLFASAGLQAMLIMLDNDPNLKLSPAQIAVLEKMAKPQDARGGPNPNALEVLIRTKKATPALLVWAAQYRYPEDRYPFPVSSLRELAVSQLNGVDPVMGPALEAALRDPWPPVRARAIRRVADAIQETHDCGPLLEVLRGSEAPMVKIEALARVDPLCEEHDAIVTAVTSYVTGNRGASPESYWPLRATATEMLAKLDQKAARDALQQSDHDVWQVRAARARAAFTLRDRDLLRTLARDEQPTVRAEALTALSELGDSSLLDLTLEALDSNDCHLVQVATGILRHTAPLSERELSSLWLTFKRLNSEPQDDARYARLEILFLLRDLAALPSQVPPVSPYLADLRGLLEDFDPVVTDAAANVIGAVTGKRPVPSPRYRPPQQPDEFELASLPRRATMTLDTGHTIDLLLLPEEAPLTVARFVKLVNAGYFRGQSFYYNIAPLIAVNGGSPNGNELSGDARFLRDEIGFERHRAGVVGLLSHGRDTADGRFFIDLTDQRGFDYDYTLFARVQIRSAEGWPFGFQLAPPPSALVAGGGIQSMRIAR